MKNIDNLYIFILNLPAIQISTFLAQLSRLHCLQKIFSYGTALFMLNILHKTQCCINDLVQRVPQSSHRSINSKGKATVKDYEEMECNLLVTSSGTGLEKNCWVHHPPTGLLRTIAWVFSSMLGPQTGLWGRVVFSWSLTALHDCKYTLHVGLPTYVCIFMKIEDQGSYH